jgi:hypothetical protein
MSKQYDTGKGKWRYGEPCDYHMGKPTRHLRGPCPKCGTSTRDYGGGWICNGLYCTAMSFHEPEWWNTDIDIKLDGNCWCATYGDFIDLQESPAGFGCTPHHAVIDLRKEFLKEQEIPSPIQ